MAKREDTYHLPRIVTDRCNCKTGKRSMVLLDHCEQCEVFLAWDIFAAGRDFGVKMGWRES